MLTVTPEDACILPLEEAIDLYTRLSEYERKRAEQATDGSSIQKELFEASAFNAGRAAAMREALVIVRAAKQQTVVLDQISKL